MDNTQYIYLFLTTFTYRVKNPLFSYSLDPAGRRLVVSFRCLDSVVLARCPVPIVDCPRCWIEAAAKDYSMGGREC